VEEVREAVEQFHTSMFIYMDEVLPLPDLGSFPLKQAPEFEGALRTQVISDLRKIRWLKLKIDESAVERSSSKSV